jgi:hypothetical protein
VARTAVVAGTATAVAGGVSRHQQEKAQEAAMAQAYEAEQAAPPPPPPPPPAAPAAPAAGGISDDVVAQLQKLGELRDAGILTEEEFSAKKAQLLGL